MTTRNYMFFLWFWAKIIYNLQIYKKIGLRHKGTKSDTNEIMKKPYSPRKVLRCLLRAELLRRRMAFSLI